MRVASRRTVVSEELLKMNKAEENRLEFDLWPPHVWELIFILIFGFSLSVIICLFLVNNLKHELNTKKFCRLTNWLLILIFKLSVPIFIIVVYYNFYLYLCVKLFSQLAYYFQLINIFAAIQMWISLIVIIKCQGSWSAWRTSFWADLRF